MKATIDIRNTTSWRTDDLRRIVKSAIDTYNAKVQSFGPSQNWRIDIKPKKYMQRLCGYGWYHSRRFTVYVPDVVTTIDDKYVDDRRDERGRLRAVRRYVKGPGKVHALSMWLTAMHELDHCRGLRHGDMSSTRDEMLAPPWLSTFVVRPRAVPAPTKPTRTDKVAAIEGRIKRLETKRKRIETALKRARRELSYHTRELKRAASKPVTLTTSTEGQPS